MKPIRGDSGRDQRKFIGEILIAPRMPRIEHFT